MKKLHFYATLIFFLKIVGILSLGAAIYVFVRNESNFIRLFIEVFSTILVASGWSILMNNIEWKIFNYFYDRRDEE